MLAQPHRRPGDWCGGVRHLPHDTWVDMRPSLGMGNDLKKAACVQVWIGEQIAFTHHRPGGDSSLLQPCEDLPRLVLEGPCGEACIQLILMPVTTGAIGEALVAGPGRMV